MLAIDTHTHVPGQGNLIPTGGIANGAVTTAKIANGAVTLAQAATGFVQLSPIAPIGSATAVNGQLVVAPPSSTITLPTAALGVVVGVIAANNVTAANLVTVTRAGGATATINGVGLLAATSFPLGMPLACTILVCDGTNWQIVSGQQDTGWLSIALPVGFTAVAGAYTPAARAVGNMVTLTGRWSAGADTALNVTLPSGVAPANALVLTANCVTGGVTTAARVQILNTGALSLLGVSTTNLGIDGLSYRLI